MENSRTTLNAKVSAVCILVGAVTLHLLNQIYADLVPIRIATVAILVMGAWAFVDEMGLRKPLNRAGFICFVLSLGALTVTIMEPSIASVAQYYLLYAFALLFSILIWSTAFLHRKREVKVLGAVGVTTALVPLIALIAGHVSVAAGAYIGVDALLSSTGGPEILSSNPIKIIEAMFIVWALVTARLLWKGKVSTDTCLPT